MDKHRLQSKIEEQQKKWELLSEMLSLLEKERILTIQVDEKFRLEKQIDNIKAEREQVEKDLNELETKLDKYKDPEGTEDQRLEKQIDSIKAEREQVEKDLNKLGAKLDKYKDPEETKDQLKKYKGILLFDIDGVILEATESLDTSVRGQEFLKILYALVKKGFELVFITGHNFELQYKRVLLPIIEQNFANAVFCFADGGSRAFKFSGNEFKEIEEYSNENLITEEDADGIIDIFNSLLRDFLTENDELLIPKVECYKRTKSYLDLWVYPIKPSFQQNQELFQNFCNDIKAIYNNNSNEFNSTEFQMITDFPNSIIIRARGLEPGVEPGSDLFKDVSKLEGEIYRKILRQDKYSEISKPEAEKRGGKITSQIAFKPFHNSIRRQNFCKKLKEKLNEEGYTNFSALAGGRTTIDVQLKGVNKAKAIRELIKRKRYDRQRMIYFGDEFTEGGNDYPVVADFKEEDQLGLIINVGNINVSEHIKNKLKNKLILDGRGPDGTMNFLKYLLGTTQLIL
jgi:hydroxymethylpyrimidine pyrophosphatase-like HAD family hydrolase